MRLSKFSVVPALWPALVTYCLVVLPSSGLAYAQEPQQNVQQDTQQQDEGDAGGLIVPVVQSVPKIFLPDIGIAGDASYERNFVSPNDPRYSTLPNQPKLRDGQFVANSLIDPFADAQLSIDLPNGSSANIEEAWLFFNKLPGGFGLTLGKFKPRFGLLDELDTFQLPMYNRPRAIANYIGDGLNDTGAQVDYVVPTLNLKAFLTVGRGDMLGASQSDSTIPVVYMGTLAYAQDLFENGSLEFGASAAEGPSPYGDYQVLVDPYLQIQLAPSQRHIWTWSAEGMFAQRNNSAYASSRRGFYTFLDYNFALIYHVGFLADWVQAPGPLATSGTFPNAYPGAPTDGSNWDFAPNFTWFVSGNTRLRVQYTHTTPNGPELADDAVAFQATFSMGNLKQLQ